MGAEGVQGFLGGVGVSPNGPSVLVLDVTLEVEDPVRT